MPLRCSGNYEKCEEAFFLFQRIYKQCSNPKIYRGVVKNFSSNQECAKWWFIFGIILNIKMACSTITRKSLRLQNSRNNIEKFLKQSYMKILYWLYQKTHLNTFLICISTATVLIFTEYLIKYFNFVIIFSRHWIFVEKKSLHNNCNNVDNSSILFIGSFLSEIIIYIIKSAGNLKSVCLLYNFSLFWPENRNQVSVVS